jgi:hypothetical protein
VYQHNRKKLEPRNGVRWCEVCRGLLQGQQKCVICRQRNSKIRKEFPEIVEYCRYISVTHKKMSKFRQPSTGVSEVDREVRLQHGPTVAHKPEAEILYYMGRYFTYLAVNRRISASGLSEQEAKRNLALTANHWNEQFSPNWRDYIWYTISSVKIGNLVQQQPDTPNEPQRTIQ